MATHRIITPEEAAALVDPRAAHLQEHLEQMRHIASGQIGLVTLEDHEDREKTKRLLLRAAKHIGAQIKFRRIQPVPHAPRNDFIIYDVLANPSYIPAQEHSAAS